MTKENGNIDEEKYSQMEVAVEPDIAEELIKIAKKENRTPEELIVEVLTLYVEERNKKKNN